jgi:hypothetical protein
VMTTSVSEPSMGLQRRRSMIQRMVILLGVLQSVDFSGEFLDSGN